MARLFTSGFEWQSLGAEFSAPAGGIEAIQTTTKHGGSAAMRVNGTLTAGSFAGAGHNITLATDIYFRYYLRIHSLPSDGQATAAIFDLMTSGGAANIISLQAVNNAGTYNLVVYYNNFASTLTNTAVFSLDTWYRIEGFYKSSGAGATDELTIKVDGSTVGTSTSLTLTGTPGYFQFGVFNGSGVSVTPDVYFDDIAFNNTSGSVNNSYPGSGQVVIAVPTGAGDNAATTGVFSYINEVPPSNTATSGSTMVELDSNGVIADYAMTDSSTLGIGSSDTIRVVEVKARIREEAAGTSSYQLRIKSASGGTVTSSTAADAGNATPRTNPNGTTAFGRTLISETDPTTGVAWTPTGTNSIDNMQCGATNVDADSTPDLWVLALCAMIEFDPAAAPPAANSNFLAFLLGA